MWLAVLPKAKWCSFPLAPLHTCCSLCFDISSFLWLPFTKQNTFHLLNSVSLPTYIIATPLSTYITLTCSYLAFYFWLILIFFIYKYKNAKSNICLVSAVSSEYIWSNAYIDYNIVSTSNNINFKTWMCQSQKSFNRWHSNQKCNRYNFQFPLSLSLCIWLFKILVFQNHCGFLCLLVFE